MAYVIKDQTLPPLIEPWYDLSRCCFTRRIQGAEKSKARRLSMGGNHGKR
jgi:hypothetical protein